MLRVSLVVLPIFAACGDQSGTLPEGDPFDQIAGYSGLPTMNPGMDCMVCHNAAPGSNASDRVWTVAGTVFSNRDAGVDDGVQGAQILVTDVNGQQLTLLSNSAGNFYTAQPLADLVDIEVQQGNRRMVMQIDVEWAGPAPIAQVGDCNSCHTLVSGPSPTLGSQGAPGRLFIPPQ
jgi:hypothetical protein